MIVEHQYGKVHDGRRGGDEVLISRRPLWLPENIANTLFLCGSAPDRSWLRCRLRVEPWLTVWAGAHSVCLWERERRVISEARGDGLHWEKYGLLMCPFVAIVILLGSVYTRQGSLLWLFSFVLNVLACYIQGKASSSCCIHWMFSLQLSPGETRRNKTCFSYVLLLFLTTGDIGRCTCVIPMLWMST